MRAHEWLNKLQDLSRWAQGTDRQKAARKTVQILGILDHLREFNPVIAGTIPLGVDLPSSDLDVICEHRNSEELGGVLKHHYSQLEKFTLKRFAYKGKDTIVCLFIFDHLKFEIFSQDQPVIDQDAVLHLIAEARLLEAAAPGAAEQIQKLKLGDMKTEPAFAKYFCIEGDPFLQLRALADAEDSEIKTIVNRATR